MLIASILSDLPHAELWTPVVLTFVSFLLVFVSRNLILTFLRQRDVQPQEYRRWVVASRNVAFILFVLIATTIWFDQLKTFAITLVAIASAIVIGFKELIMSITGGFVRSSTRAISIGDRIEVDGIRGDVIDLHLLTTTVLEIGPGALSHQQTGRAIVLPNSVFLNEHTVNETYTEAFVLHVITVELSPREDWRRAQSVLLKAANIEAEPYLEKARGHFDKRARLKGLEPPAVEPRVFVKPTGKDELTIVVRLPVPARQKGPIEQRIIQNYLDAIFPAPEPEPDGVTVDAE